jgi:hypothetical protein
VPPSARGTMWPTESAPGSPQRQHVVPYRANTCRRIFAHPAGARHADVAPTGQNTHAPTSARASLRRSPHSACAALFNGDTSACFR